MTTRNPGMDLLSVSMPGASGKAWAESWARLATNDLFAVEIMRVDEDGTDAVALTTRVGFARGVFTVPDDYVTNMKFRVLWTSTKTTGDVVFDCDYRVIAGDGTTSLDPAAATESITVTDSMAATARRRMVCDLVPTPANFSVGDTVEFEFFMDGIDAADTLAGARIIFAINLVWDDA